MPICDEVVDDLINEDQQYVTVDDFDSEDDLSLGTCKRKDLQLVHFKTIVVSMYRMTYNFLLTYSYACLLDN